MFTQVFKVAVPNDLSLVNDTRVIFFFVSVYKASWNRLLRSQHVKAVLSEKTAPPAHQ